MTRRHCTACGGPASPQWALCSICRKAADALAPVTPFVLDADGTPSGEAALTDILRAEAWERGVDPYWADGQWNVLSYGFDQFARTTADIDEPPDDARRKA